MHPRSAQWGPNENVHRPLHADWTVISTVSGTISLYCGAILEYRYLDTNRERKRHRLHPRFSFPGIVAVIATTSDPTHPLPCRRRLLTDVSSGVFPCISQYLWLLTFARIYPRGVAIPSFFLCNSLGWARLSPESKSPSELNSQIR